MPEVDRVYESAVDDNVDTGRYEVLFNNAAIGIVLADQAGNIIHLNRFAEGQFGYKRDELIGQPFDLLIPQKYRDGHEGCWEHFCHYFLPPTTDEIRVVYAVCKDGSEFPADVSLSHCELEGRPFVAAFIADNTARKKDELLSLRLKEQLDRAAAEIRKWELGFEKSVHDRTIMLQEALLALGKSWEELNLAYKKEKELGLLKSTFVSMASHEFRTPLSTILSSISLIQRYATSGDLPSQGRHVEKIRNAVKYLGCIMEDFLSLSKLEEGRVEIHMESFSKQRLLADVDDLLQELDQSNPKEQKIELVCTINVDPIVMDRKILRNILMNLVSNAIKYSPGRSIITVSCNFEPEELQISVGDQGIGISEEDQKHLFERFFRANNVAGIQGTGLGLHIVARYLDLLGGRITLNSRINEGSIFMISIPLPGRYG
ncbi:MAG TPA: PAS domain-containing sensor histidine kinase [Puia sp.]|nr:PAS domain-containing sensor histidine kinase [Puia sp.]